MTAAPFSLCEVGEGIGGSVADDFGTPQEAAEWAAENGYTVLCETCGILSDALDPAPQERA